MPEDKVRGMVKVMVKNVKKELMDEWQKSEIKTSVAKVSILNYISWDRRSATTKIDTVSNLNSTIS
jgi:hypothetical protein